MPRPLPQSPGLPPQGNGDAPIRQPVEPRKEVSVYIGVGTLILIIILILLLT